MESSQEPAAPLWNEQRRLFEILAAVHELAEGDCTKAVSLWEIGTRVEGSGDLQGAVRAYGEVFRAVRLLDEEKYLLRMRPTSLVCITPKGINYVERGAGRRRSLRLRGAARAGELSLSR